jgi:hypothetical protein
MSQDLSEQPPERLSDGEESVLQPRRREAEYRQSDAFLSLYANSVQVRTTPWDIQLTFGEISSIDQQKVIIENQLAVNLSPQQAKSLLDVLSGQVQEYERQFGEIRYIPIQPQTEEPSA